MPAINILDKEAPVLFENSPQFILLEREYYFTLPEELLKLANKIVIPSYLIEFILNIVGNSMSQVPLILKTLIIYATSYIF